MGAAVTWTQPSRAAQHSRLGKALLPFPSVPFRESLAPHHALGYLILLLRQVTGPSLASLCVLLVMRAPRQPGDQSLRLAPSTPQSFSSLPRAAAAFRSQGSRGDWRAEGRSGFLLRASQEHYGRARSRLRPPAPASRVRSGDWRRRRGREREWRGTRPPVRAQTAAAALAAMAERRAFAQKISR